MDDLPNWLAQSFVATIGGPDLLLLLLASMVAALAAVVLFARQRSRKQYYQKLYQAEFERRLSEQRYGVTLRSIGDAVIATDSEGYVELLNPVAETLLGWTEAEARSRHHSDIFHVVDERTRQPVANPVDRVIRAEGAVGVDNHTLLIARDGKEHPISDAGAPIRDKQGNIKGVVIVFRDQSKERIAEAALRASEARYRSVFESIPIILYSLTTAGRFTSLNPAFNQVTGWGVDEWLGRPFTELIAPEDRDLALAEFDQALSTNTQHSLELRILSASGEQLTLEVVGAAHWADDRVVGVSGYGRNVTERRRAEEQIRHQAKLIETVSDAIISTDMNTAIHSWNHAAETIYGWTSDEVIGKPLGQIVFTTYLDTDREHALQRLLDKGLWQGEVLQRHKNGSAVHSLASVSLIRNSLGEPTGAVAINRDITERVRSREALTNVERIYRQAIFSAGGVPYQSEYGNDRYSFLGEGFEQLTGYNAEEITSPLFCSRLRRIESYGEHASLPHEERIRLARSGIDFVWREDYLFERKDGTLVWIADHAVYTYNEAGKATGTLGILMDITERKHAEEERQQLQQQLARVQQLETVGQLAGGVAHDFNNMLAVILLRAELALQRVDAASPLHHHLTEILATGRRSAELTRQLLGFARRQPIAPRVLDLNTVVEGLLPMVHSLIGEEIDLIWKPASNLGAVKVDPAQIHQILVNLCVNARDAITGNGRILVTTENARLDEHYAATQPDIHPGEYALLTVCDSGSGMTPEVIEHIFEPFFTTKEVGQGTGLGLATVYGIVQQNHGHIIVHSVPDLGTAIKTYLPRHKEGPTTRPDPAQSELPRGRGQTILLVEDEVAVLDMGCEGLRYLGYNVITAHSPSEAIRLAESHADAIDLLLTDVVMPEMSGRLLAEQLTSQQPALRVLYMSGHPADLIVRRGILQEGVHLLSKPFSLYDLACRVHDVLSSPGVISSQ